MKDTCPQVCQFVGCGLQWFRLTNNYALPQPLRPLHLPTTLKPMYFIYLGFYVAFNTVQVISQRVVGRAEETSTYSLSGFCTVNC